VLRISGSQIAQQWRPQQATFIQLRLRHHGICCMR
jgi:hypothetical protein